MDTKDVEIGTGSFNTTYSVDGDIKQPKYRRACFSATLCMLYSNAGKGFKNNYTISLFKEKKGKHCIFISLEQMKIWFDFLKGIVNFEYSIEDTETEYVLTASIEGPKIVHLFVLTGLRYVYEYPQSCLLLWAFKCKEEVPEFKEVSLLSLVHTLWVFISPAMRELGTGHIYPTITWNAIPYKIVPEKQLKMRFEELNKKARIMTCFTDLFQQEQLYKICSSNPPEKPYLLREDENEDKKMYTINYWTDFSILQKEYPKIIELYKLLSSD